ncbi:hypothetical protein V1478_000305 [Vespula squamosa]|uniref:Uncharacterized protein n=1 Tax=Vespula squamosa TaxID=30214 RepID=A0ABD2C585_VESSQ
MVTGNPDAMAFGIPLVLTVCICMESGYVLRTTDYGYRQHEREHENLVEQPGTLGLKLTGATPAGAHGHSAHPWPHRAHAQNTGNDSYASFSLEEVRGMKSQRQPNFQITRLLEKLTRRTKKGTSE